MLFNIFSQNVKKMLTYQIAFSLVKWRFCDSVEKINPFDKNYNLKGRTCH